MTFWNLRVGLGCREVPLHPFFSSAPNPGSALTSDLSGPGGRGDVTVPIKDPGLSLGVTIFPCPPALTDCFEAGQATSGQVLQGEVQVMSSDGAMVLGLQGGGGGVVAVAGDSSVGGHGGSFQELVCLWVPGWNRSRPLPPHHRNPGMLRSGSGSGLKEREGVHTLGSRDPDGHFSAAVLPSGPSPRPPTLPAAGAFFGPGIVILAWTFTHRLPFCAQRGHTVWLGECASEAHVGGTAGT